MTISTSRKVANPTALPSAGNYAVTHYASLVCSTAGADIYYTLDGSLPTTSSMRFDPFKVIPLKAEHEGEAGKVAHYIIRAIAVKDGMLPSEVMTYHYTLAPRDKSAYVSAEIQPGVRMIRDYDDDKIFLIVGSQRALLIDAGMGSGDLRGHVEAYTGGLPLDVVITHAHPDHVACLGEFQNDSQVFMHPADAPKLVQFKAALHYDYDPTKYTPIFEGHCFDLGDRKLEVYEVPGHSAGSIVLFDAEGGILIAGDALGSNRPFHADSLWMQFEGMAPIDVYLSTLQGFRARLKGKIKAIYTGHNDAPLGEAYLDALQRAAQKFVDQGNAVLVPSLRPPEAWQVIEGDRLNDPDWAALNVRKEGCLSASPEKMATLSQLDIKGGRLSEKFSPFRLNYPVVVNAGTEYVEIMPTATSSRIRRLAVNGKDVSSGESCRVSLMDSARGVKIEVTAPDGITSQNYFLTLNSS